MLWAVALSAVQALSCSGPKQTTETLSAKTTAESSLQADETACVVTMVHAKEGCNVLLITRNEPSERTLMPVVLEPELQVEGLRVAIKFRYVRIMQSECKIGQPVAIESIRKL